MDERRLYRFGVEGRVKPGEEITFTAKKSITTGFGPMDITAAYVAAPGKTPRCIVTDVQPPERLNQLGRIFFQELGELALKEATAAKNQLIHQNEG